MKNLLKNIIGGLLSFRISILTLRKAALIRRSLSGKGLIKKHAGLSGAHNNLWNGFTTRVNDIWLNIYASVSGVEDFRYIPENIYYAEIEPRLNNKALSKAYTDKNSYHRFLDKRVLPPILLRNISGVYYNGEYEVMKDRDMIKEVFRNGGEYIIKPGLEGGGGYNVRKIEISGSHIRIRPELKNVTTIDGLLTYYKKDFLVQPFIRQHAHFSQFNEDSLNTVRILTYRSPSTEKVSILQRVLRIGKIGSVVDNQASGGIACKITGDGTLSGTGVDKFGNQYTEYNGVVFEKAGKIPFLDEICGVAVETAGRFLYSRLLGLDFGIDCNGKVLLIEVNDNYNEINFYQMNGSPLFGEYSEEVADYCRKESKSFIIDFNI